MHPLAQANTQPLPVPQVDWRAIAPELALLVAGVVLLLVVAFRPGAGRGLLAGLTLAGLVVAGALTAWNWDLERVAFEGAVSLDGITRYARAVLLATGVLATLMVAQGDVAGGSGGLKDRPPEGRGEPDDSPPEVYPLLLFALLGMVLLAAASDLLVVFIALEILSLSLYVLAGETRRLAAQEAAMKYFLLGAFSSAFLLYGIALCYGATGTTNLLGIARASADPTGDGTLLLAGVGLLAVGFCFKVSAVPFHMWTPDVYQGTPTPVAAFMAAATKVAAFSVFLRVFAGALGGLVVSWRPVIAAVAVVTMLVGAALAVVQTDLKRMLAYSSISHAGYLLVGVAAAATVPAGISASLFYLLVYAFMVMGAFMVVQYVSRLGPADDDAIRERSSLDDYRGLARRHPWAAGLLAVFMLSLTGIPPLSGFWAKYYVFLAGIQAGLTWLVVVAVISSVISAFFYLRVLVVAYLQEPVGAEPEAAPGRTPALGLALGLAGLLTVAIGLAPEALIAAARSAERILG
ncbi:MAG TPA: NADH-quinone oxidoreductase subunit NuoN [Actinomycetota bacterium]|nr:NADH-quinone oxidoreductase subunit NuoN [Actinomycetota bacterium]